jgi:hypothetical protein
MKLNKTQLNYALSRLSEKINQKRDAETPDYISSKKHDPKEIYKFLVAHNVDLVAESKFVNTWGIRDLGEVLVFPENFDKEHEENQKQREAVRAKYEAIQQSMMDKLYLCDEAEEALEFINSI